MLPESSKRWYGYNNAAFEQQSRGQRHFTTPNGPLKKLTRNWLLAGWTKLRFTYIKMKHVNVLEVAKYLSKKAQADNIADFTPLKLQKILFFVEGWYMGNNDEPLFFEDALAWEYGPVYKNVWERFSHQSPSQVKPDSFSDIVDIDDEEVTSAIDAVWAQYKDKPAGELVYLSHLVPSWRQARDDQLSDVIDKSETMEYFRKLAHES